MVDRKCTEALPGPFPEFSGGAWGRGYGQTLLEMAGVKGGKVTEEILLEVPVFMSATYNSQNVITGFVTH